MAKGSSWELYLSGPQFHTAECSRYFSQGRKEIIKICDWLIKSPRRPGLEASWSGMTLGPHWAPDVGLWKPKILPSMLTGHVDWSENSHWLTKNSLHPHFLPCLFPYQTLPSMNVIGRTWIYRYFQSWKCKNLIFFPLGKWDLQVGKQILLRRVTVKDKARTKNPLSLELGSWDNWKCYNFILCRISLPRLENSL